MITNGNQRLLPPGPWKLPLVRSLHHLIGELPHHALRNLARKYGPLMHLQLGEVHAVVVSSPHLAKQFLKVHDHSFAARPELMVSDIIFYRQKDIVFLKYGDYWKHIVKYAFSELLGARWSSHYSLIRQDRGGFDVADLFPSWILLHEISGMRNRLMSMHQKIDVILENIINEHKDNQANGKKGNGEFGGERNRLKKHSGNLILVLIVGSEDNFAPRSLQIAALFHKWNSIKLSPSADLGIHRVSQARGAFLDFSEPPRNVLQILKFSGPTPNPSNHLLYYGHTLLNGDLFGREWHT
ncbi:premnaspirodiene oxygenase-like [Lycium ferocissimum]|uniref:premnaspirodiene oxygenase-like n=1 Tax=Lycium ferocissimum TaxID=112874 RepID=UPI002816561E|nr:premnaspirodiene oxygenase-like [Lycium ferocissimum]